MSTALVLGNGNLLVNVDDRLQVTDFYFPHIGQENHLGTFQNKLFFRINGEFAMVNHHDFEVDINYEQNSLVGKSILKHKNSQLEIRFMDFVVPNEPIFIRNFEIENKNSHDIEVYVYFQNNFAMYEYDIGDTTVWYQPGKSIVHYKKDRYIGIGSTDKLYQFTCAARTDNHNRGAYPSLESGELYFNPISNGSVNSCVSYKFNVKPGETVKSNYYNICGRNLEDVTSAVKVLRSPSTESLYGTTKNYWEHWVESKIDNIFDTKKQYPSLFGESSLDKKIFNLYKRSLLTIRTQIDNGGAIIAANDGRYLKEGGKDTYSYYWPRDGASIIMTLIDAGFQELSDTYFEYAHKLLTPEGYFFHKYYPDPTSDSYMVGSSWHPWVDKCGYAQLPIQEDETALNLLAVWNHYEKFGDLEFVNHYWDSFIFPMMNFLGNYRYTMDYPADSMEDHISGFNCNLEKHEFNAHFAGSKLPRPSYDLWEERRGISSYTCATVYAALKAASRLSEAFGREDFVPVFAKFAEEIKSGVEKHLFDKDTGIFLSRINCNPSTNQCEFDAQMDASLYGLWYYGMFDINDPRIKATMKAVEDRLVVKSPIGGVARRENDFYHKIDPELTGNPWFICTLWLAQYWIEAGKPEKAKEYIAWAVDHADSTGMMAEQAHPHTGHGISVKPLTWSHAEFVNTINRLKKKLS
ncbi:glycoside hydrolase family 15 protein [Candidatus Dojkabacteria bacterium]|uniref:Glycoside hydrolase family 15 protein n=1 Tax=Candidatus Dojkabacteria bacterium TaxID=2099670 RepID=A0A955L7V6_9BACT|nr:glycoside hydrolase family 15 protein [Candidatus Dojkabacteria bacterium]